MNEGEFLRRHEERLNVARQASAGMSDTAIARAEFTRRLADLSARIDRILASANDEDRQQRVDEASDEWRTMQSLIQDAAQVQLLPARDVQSANDLLNSSWSSIEAQRSKKKPAKFGFSSKIKKTKTVDADVQKECAVSGPSNSDNVTQAGTCISHKTGETIFVDSADAVFIRGCTNCTFLCLPIEGSVFVSDSAQCKLYVCCQQMRIKNCEKCDVYAACSSMPIIESSTSIGFGAYLAWEGLLGSADRNGNVHATHEEWIQTTRWCQASGGNPVTALRENFKKVGDFGWLKAQKSPNWYVIDQREWSLQQTRFQRAASVS